MPIHILYLSGLGDRYDPFRRFCLKFWHIYGVTTELIPLTWADGVPYEEKISVVEKAINNAKGKRIVLIGESAGGSMALNIYARRPSSFHKVLTICGKNTKANHVSPLLYRKNPAFKTSMYAAEESVKKLTKQQRQAFISIHPLADHVVPVKETLIPNCQRVLLWSLGHFTTIALALTLASFVIVHHAKK